MSFRQVKQRQVSQQVLSRARGNKAVISGNTDKETSYLLARAPRALSNGKIVQESNFRIEMTTYGKLTVRQANGAKDSGASRMVAGAARERAKWPFGSIECSMSE